MLTHFTHALSLCSALPAAMFAAWHQRKLIWPSQKALKWFVWFMVLAEIVAFIPYSKHQNNLHIVAIYTVIELFFIVRIYTTQLRYPRLAPVYYGLALLLGLNIVYAIYVDGQHFPTQARIYQLIFIAAITIIQGINWLRVGNQYVHDVVIIMGFWAYHGFGMITIIGFNIDIGNMIPTFYMMRDLLNTFCNFMLFFSLYHYIKYYAIHH